MDKREKRPYEAPRLTVVTITAERGYATSYNLTFLAIPATAVFGEGMEASRTSYGDGGDVFNF